DMRESSHLVTALSADEYLALLNRYFDATAGGQVLKFIGDAVLGIFQSDRPGEDVARTGARSRRNDVEERQFAYRPRPPSGCRDRVTRGRSHVRKRRDRRPA